MNQEPMAALGKKLFLRNNLFIETKKRMRQAKKNLHSWPRKNPTNLENKDEETEQTD